VPYWRRPRSPENAQTDRARVRQLARRLDRYRGHRVLPVLPRPASRPRRRRQGETADWANTTIAVGDLGEEVDRLRRGGDGYVVAHGGISFWRSLARLDLIDEYRVTLVPYLAGEGPRLFEDVGTSRPLDLLSSIVFSNGLELEYRRRR
jgi:dihydrofolate reductase